MAVHRLGSRKVILPLFRGKLIYFVTIRHVLLSRYIQIIRNRYRGEIKIATIFQNNSSFPFTHTYIHHPIKHPFLPGKVDDAQREYVKNTPVIRSAHFRL